VGDHEAAELHEVNPATNTLMKCLKLLCLFSFIVPMVLASCGASQKPSQKPLAFQPENWQKVKDKPPVFYPKGVSKDHATSHRDGMWVTTGDPAGTSYFIPNRGVDSSKLVAEALTQVTPEGLKIQNQDDDPGISGDRVRDALGSVATGIFAVAVEADRAASSARYRHGEGRSDAGLWENKARR